jgi:hypothetical protein
MARSSGERLVVSVGRLAGDDAEDGEMKRGVRSFVMGSIRLGGNFAVASLANPPLNQNFKVRRAALVFVETIFESVFEPIHAEMVGASCVGSIQKRTVNNAICHNTLRAGACANNEYRQAGRASVNRGMKREDVKRD